MQRCFGHFGPQTGIRSPSERIPDIKQEESQLRHARFAYTPTRDSLQVIPSSRTMVIPDTAKIAETRENTDDTAAIQHQIPFPYPIFRKPENKFRAFHKVNRLIDRPEGCANSCCCSCTTNSRFLEQFLRQGQRDACCRMNFSSSG